MLESVREQARMASLSLPYAGTWLNVVPSPALGLHLRGPKFITALKYRLGADIYRTAAAGPTATHWVTTPSAAAVRGMRKPP